jgi:hypothetical protein
MASVNNRLVIKHYDGFGGNFIDSQYLGAAFDIEKPYVFENTMMKIYASKNQFFTQKQLLGLTGANSFGSMEIPDEVYRWYLRGAEEKLANSMGLVNATLTAPGLNGTTFQIKLDLDYYHKPDVLMGEDSRYPLQILDGPISDGTGYIYTVRIQGSKDDPTMFLPLENLEEGAQFSKVWTSTPSEGNEDFGTQQVPNSFQLESQLGWFAQSLEITDKALRDQGRLALDWVYTNPMTGKEQKVSQFIPMAEAMMHDQLYESMEAAMVYGRKETVMTENSKYWTKTGPGLREQLRDSWVQYYSDNPSVDLYKDYLLDIYFSREDIDNRKTVAMTGTLGSLFLHDALASQAASFLSVDTHFTKEIDRSRRYLSFGAQYTHYKGPEGIEFSLMRNPMYDSRKYEKRTHPTYKDMPIDSGRYTFLNFGSNRTQKGKPNIMMLSVKDSYRYFQVLGSVGPNGPITNRGTVSVMKAMYSVGVEGSKGIVIFDPTSCGEMILASE